MGPTEGYESGFETDGGNNSDTGSERGHSQRKYENAVLKIVQRVLIDSNIPLLKGVGEGASALVTRESRQALMTEVKRRMRTDRGMLRSILRRRREDYHETARAHEKMERRLPRIPGAIGVRRAREGIQRRWRYTITGAEDVRVRDHYGGKLSTARSKYSSVRERVRVKAEEQRAKMEEPTAIRLRDKLSFMLGVVGCFVIEACVLQAPQLYPYLFLSFFLPLYVLRLYIYGSLSWHWFLVDFCYFSNFACVWGIVGAPASTTLLIMNFAHTSGPLALAIPIWRNSLVFHSLDKVTSVFVHALPGLLTFMLRWVPATRPEGLQVPERLELGPTLGLALAGYAAWQLGIVLLLDVLFGARIANTPHAMTSVRWLTTADAKGGYSGLVGSVFKACRALGVLQPGELFDSETWKTKCVFMMVQLLYTVVTLLPVVWLWESFALHLAYLLAIYTYSIWNGGSYYIEVFSKAYRTQFEGDIAARRRAAFESLGAPTRQPPPPAAAAAPAAAAPAAATTGTAAALKKQE